MEDIKLLKVELAKIETLYKKYKEVSGSVGLGINFSIGISGTQGEITTDELLIEVSKVKHLL